MLKKIFLVLVFSFIVTPASISYAAPGPATDVFKDVCKNAEKGTNTPAACEDKSLGGGNPIYGPNGILTKIVSILSILTAIAAVISIMIGGLRFITSGSSSEDVKNARELIIYAVVGLLIAALAQILVRLVLSRI